MNFKGLEDDVSYGSLVSTQINRFSISTDNLSSKPLVPQAPMLEPSVNLETFYHECHPSEWSNPFAIKSLRTKWHFKNSDIENKGLLKVVLRKNPPLLHSEKCLAPRSKARIFNRSVLDFPSRMLNVNHQKPLNKLSRTLNLNHKKRSCTALSMVPLFNCIYNNSQQFSGINDTLKNPFCSQSIKGSSINSAVSKGFMFSNNIYLKAQFLFLLTVNFHYQLSRKYKLLAAQRRSIKNRYKLYNERRRTLRKKYQKKTAKNKYCFFIDKREKAILVSLKRSKYETLLFFERMKHTRKSISQQGALFNTAILPF
jgi:hypothetical protein